MKKSTFGEHLRMEREMRGVSLEEIAAATRISTRFLAALENEQWERLPGGVFNRGFVRSVAHFLGLNEDTLVAEYAMATNDKPEVAVWLDKPAKPKRRSVPWVLMLLLVALGVGGWFAYRQGKPLVDAWREPMPSVPAPEAPEPPAAKAGNAAAIAGEASAGAPVPVLETLELRIDAGKETRLRVTADGKQVFDGRITAGEQKRFQAKERFEISAGNSGAVFLELNGLTVPPLGQPDEPGSITITHEDLKRLRGGQN